MLLLMLPQNSKLKSSDMMEALPRQQGLDQQVSPNAAPSEEEEEEEEEQRDPASEGQRKDDDDVVDVVVIIVVAILNTFSMP